MLPHERSLVEKHREEPFAILGVDSDPDREALKRTLAAERITWRSFWDESTSGPIATRWNVTGWPTTYVLDVDGVIRYRGVRDGELERAVDELLAEARARAAR